MEKQTFLHYFMWQNNNLKISANKHNDDEK